MHELNILGVIRKGFIHVILVIFDSFYLLSYLINILKNAQMATLRQNCPLFRKIDMNKKNTQNVFYYQIFVF